MDDGDCFNKMSLTLLETRREALTWGWVSPQGRQHPREHPGSTPRCSWAPPAPQVGQSWQLILNHLGTLDRVRGPQCSAPPCKVLNPGVGLCFTHSGRPEWVPSGLCRVRGTSNPTSRGLAPRGWVVAGALSCIPSLVPGWQRRGGPPGK